MVAAFIFIFVGSMHAVGPEWTGCKFVLVCVYFDFKLLVVLLGVSYTTFVRLRAATIYETIMIMPRWLVLCFCAC